MHGGDSLFGRMTSATHVYRDSGIDPDLDHRAHKVTEKVSESINTIANEPSVAFYRIQEHVRKTLPQLVEQKHEVEDVQQQVQGACFDTEYAGNAVKSMQKSIVHFQNIQELLKNAMFMKQQIDYEEARKQSRLLSTAGAGNVRQDDGPSGSRTEDGGGNMVDSAVSTDSSLVSSGHANTEAGEYDDAAEAEERDQPSDAEDAHSPIHQSDAEGVDDINPNDAVLEDNISRSDTVPEDDRSLNVTVPEDDRSQSVTVPEDDRSPNDAVPEDDRSPNDAVPEDNRSPNDAVPEDDKTRSPSDAVPEDDRSPNRSPNDAVPVQTVNPVETGSVGRINPFNADTEEV